jgi:hypothetical protein
MSQVTSGIKTEAQDRSRQGLVPGENLKIDSQGMPQPMKEKHQKEGLRFRKARASVRTIQMFRRRVVCADI